MGKTLVKQKSAIPTRKLTAAMIATSLAGIIKAFVISHWPDFADPVIWEPLPIIVGFLVGYFVKDEANS